MLIAGCAYTPGSFRDGPSHPFVGQHVSVGCIDVAVERRPDLPGGGSVLGYGFGNRCDHAATVDLAQAHIVGRTYDGREVPLAAWDPHHEIQALLLDGRATGTEALAYKATEPLAEVCVDAASIAHDGQESWLCFARNAPPPAHHVGAPSVATKEAP